MQKHEAELRAERTSLNEQLSRVSDELSSLKASSGGSTARLEEVTRSLKDERARTRQLELQIETTADELRETKAQAEATAQKMDALKKKLEKERERLETELEETKTRHESELEELRRKVRLSILNSIPHLPSFMLPDLD